MAQSNSSMDEESDQLTLPVTSSTASEAANKVSPIRSSFTHRFFHPPKLERKHSSGDLHSRLKTRKILGVGETDNGDIHRSKISQLLGHNEHLYVKFPRGFGLWHISMAVVFTAIGLMTFLFPDQWFNITKEEAVSDSQLKASTRYFGAVVLTMGLLMWSFVGTMDKHIARTLLAAVVVIHLLFLFASTLRLWQEEIGTTSIILVVVESIAAIASSSYFYWAITFCNMRMRKSASHKELRDTFTKYNSIDSSFNSISTTIQNKTE